jgi:hypothetical protein
VRHICQLVLKITHDSLARRDSHSAKSKAGAGNEDEDTDADDDDEQEEEMQEQLLRQAACNCATAVMTHHADLFVSEGLPGCLSLVLQLIHPSRPSGDHRLGLYVISHLSEHLGERIVPHWPSFLPQVLDDITSKDMELRAPACYAVSFVVRQAAFSPHAVETGKKLAELVGTSRSSKKGKKAKAANLVADNALSALMELLTHHDSAVAAAAAQLWGAWVAGLPCVEDDSEGVRNHGTLVQLVQMQKPEVIGAGAANVPRLLSILVDVYQTEMVDDLTSFSIGKLLAGLGQSQLEQYAASFSEKQRKKLLRVVREASRTVST